MTQAQATAATATKTTTQPATLATAELQTEQLVTDVLATIDREREREIVGRRFGLYDRKETLEQIGEMLGITRERVRQLEKSVVTRLRAAAEEGELPHIADFQTRVLELLHNTGELARVSELTAKLNDTRDDLQDDKKSDREEQARVAFLSQLCPKLAVITEDDNYYYSVGDRAIRDEKAIKASPKPSRKSPKPPIAVSLEQELAPAPASKTSLRPPLWPAFPSN
jgi:vacuolar-type H+-ATPase subunit I/STV1